MRKTLYLFLLTFLFSCTSHVERKKDPEPTPRETPPPTASTAVVEEIQTNVDSILTTFHLDQWVDSFAFNSRINCFNEDSISRFEEIVWKDYNSHKQHSAPIIGKLAQQIEGIENLEPWHMSVNEGTKFLYSIQRRKDHIGITIIGGSDAWITEIKYLSFDLEGNKISQVILAAQGGDGGYFTRGHGCFINDSIYSYTFVETEYNAESEMPEIYDSGELTYLIHANGIIDTLKRE